MKNKPIIVLGLGPAGLFLVRQLAYITDNIYAVGRHDDVGMYSKYVTKEKHFYATNEKELRDVFKIIKNTEIDKPTLYVCSDQYLSILLENSDQWSEYFILAGSGFDTLKLINDKNTINKFCKEHNLDIPVTLSLAEFRDNRHFPAIIKWVEKRIETAVNSIGKISVCLNDEEFNEIDAIIRKGGIRDDELFVQTYIEGKNNCQFSIGGFYQNGKYLAYIVVNQIKQFPQGISAEVIACSSAVSDKLQIIAGDFVKELNYSGFLEMEFKLDESTGKIYLLDVNPRPWGWISILGAVYSDFYRVLLGEKPLSDPQNAVWKSPARILLGRKNKQNVDTKLDVHGFKTAYDIKDYKDFYPSIMIFFMALKKIMRRVRC